MSLENTSSDELAAFGPDQRKVGIAEYNVTSTQAVLVTYGLGSCLGVSLFDPVNMVAGLIHIKRPSQTGSDDEDRAVFADSGIELLVDELMAEGAERDHIEAKIAGGSNICGFTFSGGKSTIGEQNIEQAETTLAELDIPIIKTDVGGDYSRTLRLDGGSGTLTIESEAKRTRTI